MMSLAMRPHTVKADDAPLTRRTTWIGQRMSGRASVSNRLAGHGAPTRGRRCVRVRAAAEQREHDRVEAVGVQLTAVAAVAATAFLVRPVASHRACRETEKCSPSERFAGADLRARPPAAVLPTFPDATTSRILAQSHESEREHR